MARYAVQSRAHAAEISHHERYLANRTPLDCALDDVEGALYALVPTRDADFEFAYATLMVLQKGGGALSAESAREIGAAVTEDLGRVRLA